jgi:hypothetical protein
MDRRPRLSASPVLVVAVVLAAGCAGPPIPAPIEGIPVCPDFTTGNAKMEGGLRYPVRVRVLDGKNVLYKSILPGLRHPDDPKPRSYIADDNAKYEVEWAQCNNPRAPRTAAEASQSSKAREKAHDGEATAYECGEAIVYKTDVLETRKGDRASHVITFALPPNAECWASEAPAPATVRDAGAPPPAEADAGASEAGAGSNMIGDAGAMEAGAADAGALRSHRVPAGGR